MEERQTKQEVVLIAWAGELFLFSFHFIVNAQICLHDLVL